MIGYQPPESAEVGLRDPITMIRESSGFPQELQTQRVDILSYRHVLTTLRMHVCERETENKG